MASSKLTSEDYAAPKVFLNPLPQDLVDAEFL